MNSTERAKQIACTAIDIADGDLRRQFEGIISEIERRCAFGYNSHSDVVKDLRELYDARIGFLPNMTNIKK